MKTLIGFFFETGSYSGQYYEVWVLAENNPRVEFEKIHSIVNNEAFCELNLDEDEEYDDIAERIMNESGYKWERFTSPANGIHNILTYYL